MKLNDCLSFHRMVLLLACKNMEKINKWTNSERIIIVELLYGSDPCILNSQCWNISIKPPSIFEHWLTENVIPHARRHRVQWNDMRTDVFPAIWYRPKYRYITARNCQRVRKWNDSKSAHNVMSTKVSTQEHRVL